MDSKNNKRPRRCRVMPPPLYPSPRAARGNNAFGLMAFILIFLKYKRAILSVVLVVASASLLLINFRSNIYLSEAVITPKKQVFKTNMPSVSLAGRLGLKLNRRFLRGKKDYSIQQLQLTLKSRQLAQYIHTKYDKQLYPYLFPKSWDPATKTWRKTRKKPLKPQQIVQRIRRMVRVKADIRKGLLTLGVRNRDPETSKYLADLYLKELSEFMRQKTIGESRANQRFLDKQIGKTADVLLKQKLYELLAGEQEEEVFARAHTPYGFRIIDPPIAPDIDKFSKPNRPLLFLTHLGVALFLLFCWIGSKECIHRLKRVNEKRNAKKGLAQE